MSIKKITAVALAGLLSLGIVATVGAQDAQSPDELVAARKQAMKANGGILRNAGSLAGAEAVAAMQTVVANYTALPDLFAEGAINADSKALPKVWEDWNGFLAIVEKGKLAAEQGLAAAEAGDAAAYGAALQALGATCGECHQGFRS